MRKQQSVFFRKFKTRLPNVLFLILSLPVLFIFGCNEYNGKEDSKSSIEKSKTVLSKTYHLDQIYKSMKGPKSTQKVYLLESDRPELLWLTGYKAVMVGEDGETQMPQEFMCHSNLDFNVGNHKKLFGWKYNNPTTRLFTLSQGQFEVRFPEGFGFPMMSDEQFSLTTQVLNLNHPDKQFKLRHKISFEYIKDTELKDPLKPLFMISAYGLKLLEGKDGYFNVAHASEEQHGESCLIGENADASVLKDRYQRKFAGHWVVKPGREVNNTHATKMLNVPYDTTIHYIAVHLHPFAESLELKDLTTGKTVFKSDVEWEKGKIGIKKVQYYSSKEGIPIYKDHEYQLISVYNNTTDEDQDSMAVMFLYVLDKEFQRPKLNDSERQSDIAKVNLNEPSIERSPAIKRVTQPPKISEERIVFHTIEGDIILALYPEAAPEHVNQILQLVELGVYDTTHFFRVEPGFIIQISSAHDRSGGPLSDEQKSAIKKIKAEFSDIKHEKGILSMARYPEDPDSAETSFSILLNDAPHLDKQFTIFGKVVSGYDTIERILEIPRSLNHKPEVRVEISSAELVKNK